jgi:catechol 2,3-dioxygenase-like lactoylglutathione lyase family enzyme
MIDSHTALPYIFRQQMKTEEVMTGKFLTGYGVAALALGLSAMVARADIMPSPTLAGGIALANVTISVADLDKSTKFYQALGFAVGDAHEPPMALAAKTLGVPATSKLDIRFISRDGMIVELVHLTPASKNPASTGVPGQLGLSNFTFRVDDVARVAALIKASGGTVLDQTKASMGQGAKAMDFLFCTDPDGTRLELVGQPKG